MKQFLTVLLVVIIVSPAFTQTRLGKNSESWTVNISYPQISNPVNDAETGFNEIVRQRFYAERNSFISTLNEPSFFPEYAFDYDLKDTVLYSDNFFISICCYGSLIYHNTRILKDYSFSVNYDLETKRELLLKDLFSDGYLEVLSGYCLKQLASQKSDYNLTITEDNSMLVNCAGPLEKNYRVFNLTKNGILVSFVTYSVQNVLSTPVHSRVMVPYNLLKDYEKPGSKISFFTK